jgi:hypothetical protein
MLENTNVEINDSIRIKLKKSKKLESGDLEMEIERHRSKSEIDIRGTMTLEEVVKTYGVPLLRLKKELGIPEDVAASERVGRLKKRYDFTMGDVKTVVMEHGRTRER